MEKSIFLFVLILFLGFVSCTVDESDATGDSDDRDVAETVDDEGKLPDDSTEYSKEDDSENYDEKPDDVPEIPDGGSDIPDDGHHSELESISDLIVTDTTDSISLSWKNPEADGFQQTVIVQRLDRYAEHRYDGDVIYEENGESHTLTDVEIGETYFFTVFACYGPSGCSEGVNGYAQPCYSQLDVVFSMDVSTSMDFILEDLENELGLVWDFIQNTFSEEPRLGLTVFVDDVTVTNNGEPFETQAELQSEFNKWRLHTSTNRQTQSNASNTDWPENSLDSIAFSARDFNWRDSKETLRIIVHSTDDTFYEYPDSFSSGIAVEYTYDETIELLVNEKIRVAAFAAKLGGRFGNVNVEPGFFTDYNGKPSIPEATGGEVYLINDVENGTLHVYQVINDFIKNVMCQSYDQKL